MAQNLPLHTRLLSLDVFRGITVAAMILVNNPGDWGHIYPPLEHAEWNGCTPTDLIFPFFLFIVGVSISFALEKKTSENHPKLFWSIAKRAVTIFALGFILALIPKVFTAPLDAFKTVRIMGVLQRIALVYLISAFIFIKTDSKTQFRIFICFLAFYWILLTFVPVPGFGDANLGKETNLGAWLDRTLLTSPHLWKEAVTWDPEGILGTISAVATAIFGMLIGTYLKRKDLEESVRVAWIFSVGLIALLLGMIWNLEFPINKALWTSSYVLYAGGWACMGLALLYWLIDVQGLKSWTKPFVVYGVNAITVFFFSAIVAKTMNLIKVTNAQGVEVSSKKWMCDILYTPYLSPLNASLAGAITFVLIWMAILWIMYNLKIFIKV